MTETIEKDARGRFAPGNRGGPGRPRKSYEAAYQLAVYRSLPPEQIARVVDVLVTAALQGDVQAARAVLALVLPKTPDPFEVIDPPAREDGP